MKNFSMPEHVSATLELDELTRLRRSLEAAVSKEETEEILSELSLCMDIGRTRKTTTAC